MSDELIEGLLDEAGRGDEELHDPREGEHESILKEVRLVENSPAAQVRHALVLSYDGMTDTEGRSFGFDDRTNIPTSSSEDTVKRMFQAALHSLGLVPYEDKRPYFADTEQQRQALLAVFKTRVGMKIPLKLYTDKNGWLRGRVQRPRG